MGVQFGTIYSLKWTNRQLDISLQTLKVYNYILYEINNSTLAVVHLSQLSYYIFYKTVQYYYF